MNHARRPCHKTALRQNTKTTCLTTLDRWYLRRRQGVAGAVRQPPAIREAREFRFVAGRLGPDESEFIGERDSFYMASVGATGWPYVQHRGGAKAF